METIEDSLDADYMLMRSKDSGLRSPSAPILHFMGPIFWGSFTSEFTVPGE